MSSHCSRQQEKKAKHIDGKGSLEKILALEGRKESVSMKRGAFSGNWKVKSSQAHPG